MPKPAVIFPDSQLAVRDLLRELVPAGEGATISTREIEGATGRWPIPYIQVRNDGRYRNSRLNGRSTVRVLCYGRDEGDSNRLASLCEGLLLAEVSTDKIRGCNPLLGPLDSTDIDNDLPFTYFTVTVRLRPQAIPE